MTFILRKVHSSRLVKKYSKYLNIANPRHLSSWSRNTRSLIFAFLALVLVALFFVFTRNALPDIDELPPPGAEFQPAGQIMMIGTPEPFEIAGFTFARLDLLSGKLKNFSLPGCFGATGFAYNPQMGKVMIACVDGEAQYWQYDIYTGDVSRSINYAHQDTFRALVACVSTTGNCYYSRGLPSKDIYGRSDSELLVVGVNNVVQSVIPFPDQDENRVPDRMSLAKIDGKEKLFVLSRATGATIESSVHRFDVDGNFFDLACPISADSHDMVIFEKRIFVSLKHKEASGNKDVLVLDANTCAPLGSVVVPAGGDGYQSAMALRVTKEGVHVGGLDGVYTFSLDALAQVNFASTSSFLYEGAVGGGKIYMTMPNDTIFEFDPATLAVTRKWSKRVNAGRIFVVEPSRYY